MVPRRNSYPLRANSTYMMSVGNDFVYMYVGQAMQAAAGICRCEVQVRQLTEERIVDAGRDRPVAAGLSRK